MNLKSTTEKYFEKKGLAELLIALIVLAISLIFYSKFLIFIESREGLLFTDPILSLFRPIDLTWVSFGFIYGGIVLAGISLLKKRDRLVLIIIAYTILVFFRMIAMYSIPLEPPTTLIPLQDPIVEYFGTGTLLTRDLFFSGHTSLAVLLCLAMPRGIVKWILLVSAVIIAFSVLLQHVHYFVDVLVAPFFSYVSWRLALSFREFYRSKKNNL